jgi:hypothetical protein
MVSPQVEEVVMAAMSKSMHDRPSAADLARRFGQAVGRRATDVRPVQVVPPVFGPKPPPPPLPQREEASEPTHIIDSADVPSDTGLSDEDRNPMRRLLDKIFDSEN